MSNRSRVTQRTLFLLSILALVLLSTLAAAEDRTEAVWGAEDLAEEDESIPTERSRRDGAPQVKGRVIEVDSGVAIIDLGREHGLTEGMKVEFYRVENISLGGEEVEREESIAIETISLLAEQFSEVDLSINITVEEGVRVRPTDKPRALFRSPPAVRDVAIAQVILRPILLPAQSGFGMLIDASLGFRFSHPLAVDLRLDPMGFTLTDRDDALNASGNILVSYASDRFQIGVGAGLVNSRGGLESNFVESSQVPYTGVDLDTILHARFGASEGSHFAVNANITRRDDRWTLGGFGLVGQRRSRWIPRDDIWITGALKVSTAASLLTETGVRALIVGNGGPGSLFITPSVGAAMLLDNRYDACTQQVWEGANQRTAVGYCHSQRSYEGLMIGIGLEWRN